MRAARTQDARGADAARAGAADRPLRRGHVAGALRAAREPLLGQPAPAERGRDAGRGRAVVARRLARARRARRCSTALVSRPRVVPRDGDERRCARRPAGACSAASRDCSSRVYALGQLSRLVRAPSLFVAGHGDVSAASAVRRRRVDGRSEPRLAGRAAAAVRPRPARRRRRAADVPRVVRCRDLRRRRPLRASSRPRATSSRTPRPPRVGTSCRPTRRRRRSAATRGSRTRAS